MPKQSGRRRKLWKTVRLLRLFASPPDKRKVRVSVSSAVPDDCLGDCSQRKDHYLIRLNKTVVEASPDAVYLILAHEWAHTLVWDICPDDHGDLWGMAVARCWRIIHHELTSGDIQYATLD